MSGGTPGSEGRTRAGGRNGGEVSGIVRDFLEDLDMWGTRLLKGQCEAGPQV